MIDNLQIYFITISILILIYKPKISTLYIKKYSI